MDFEEAHYPDYSDHPGHPGHPHIRRSPGSDNAGSPRNESPDPLEGDEDEGEGSGTSTARDTEKSAHEIAMWDAQVNRRSRQKHRAEITQVNRMHVESAEVKAWEENIKKGKDVDREHGESISSENP